MEKGLAALVRSTKIRRSAQRRRQQSLKYPTKLRNAHSQIMRRLVRGRQLQYPAVLLFREEAQRKQLKLGK